MSINWINIYKEYKGKWVALSQNEATVISYGLTAEQALKKAQKKGHDRPILTRVPKKLESYVGIF